jgi:hypothetical protein
MYEFLYFVAVIMYEFIYFLQCKIKVASTRAPRACTTSVQRELRGQSPSSPPAPTRLRPAAPTVRVAWGSPELRAAAPIVRVHTAALIVRVACGCPDS